MYFIGWCLWAEVTIDKEEYILSETWFPRSSILNSLKLFQGIYAPNLPLYIFSLTQICPWECHSFLNLKTPFFSDLSTLFILWCNQPKNPPLWIRLFPKPEDRIGLAIKIPIYSASVRRRLGANLKKKGIGMKQFHKFQLISCQLKKWIQILLLLEKFEKQYGD